MAVTIEETSETELTQSIVTPSVRLTFTWVDDRWVHALVLPTSASIPSSLVQSMDRDEGESPLSPAYQQLHLQREGDAQLAMLVGQSGHHHYSAAFTVREQPNGSISIEADVADRLMKSTEAVQPLACTYQVALGPGQIEAGSPGLVRWQVQSPAGSLELATVEQPGGKTLLSVCGAPSDRSLAQLLASSEASGPTQRCGYRWTWVPVPLPA